MDEQTGEIIIDDHMVSFAWSFDWALCQVKKPGECVTSPIFSTPMPDLTVQQWKLQLYPEGANRKSRGHLSLRLRTAESKRRVHLWKMVTFHLKGNGDEELYRMYSWLDKPKPIVVSRDWYVSKQVIEKRSDEFLKYGKLTVICTIMEPSTDLKHGFTMWYSDQESPTPVQRSRSLANLTASKSDVDDDKEEEEVEAEAESEPPGDQFEAFLASGRSDVTIAVGDRSFHAHRAILAARSTFFRGLFEQDMAQRKRTSFVDMSELDAEVVVELLRYVYLDRVEGLTERASVLLGPAHKYALEKLKAVCEAVMIKGLNVDNASEYLVLSFLHEADRLQKKAMDFVVSHSLDVFSTPGFKAIAGSHANVIAALLKTVAVRGKKEQVQEQPKRIENKNLAVEDKKGDLPVRTENKKLVVEGKEEQVQEREQPKRIDNVFVRLPKPALTTKEEQVQEREQPKRIDNVFVRLPKPALTTKEELVQEREQLIRIYNKFGVPPKPAQRAGDRNIPRSD